MGAQSGELVDHVNHDGLDNRRSNLRICTVRQNIGNARGAGPGYRGVSFHPNNPQKPWRARWNGKHLGYFESEWDAAEAYNQVAAQEYGDFALLNVRRAV
jgi:hypothetical protein